MPDYKITAPDGNAYTVTAPEGATQDQVLAYAQANYQHPAVQAGQPVQHADFSDVQGGVVEKPRSLGQDLGRAAIMTGRNVVQGVTGIPALLRDAAGGDAHTTPSRRLSARIRASIRAVNRSTHT